MKIGPAVPEICSRTDRHRDRQTVDHNIPHTYRGGVNTGYTSVIKYTLAVGLPSIERHSCAYENLIHALLYTELDNVAINDVLPLKAARREAIANLKCFWCLLDTRYLTSMVTFTFSMRRQLIRLASAQCISSRLSTFGWVRFLRATRGKHNAEFTKGG